MWAAGVAASPAAQWLGAPADRVGRIMVEPDLTVPGYPDIFAIGDTAHVARPGGGVVPGIARRKAGGQACRDDPSGKAFGRPAAKAVCLPACPDLAAIGKRAAVLDFGRLRFTGRLAWWLWGITHIFFLIGLRNRLAVALNWLWIYATGQRSARLITQGEQPKLR